MRLTVNANELLRVMYNLDKVKSKYEANKSVLVLDDLFVYNSGTYGVSQAKLTTAELIDGSYGMLPVTIIPYLKQMGDQNIEIHIDSNDVTIKFLNNTIEIRQIAADPSDITINRKELEWLDVDVGDMSRIMYAAGEKLSGYDKVWVYDNDLIVTDRFRVSVLHTDNLGIENNTILPINNIGLVKSTDTAKITTNNEYVWFGNDDMYTSFPKEELQLSRPVIDLVKTTQSGSYLVNKDLFVTNVMLAYSNTTKQVNFIDIRVDSNGVNVLSKTDKGVVDVKQPVIEGYGDVIDLRLDIYFLNEVVKNLVSSQIEVGVVNFKTTSVFVIVDDNVSHYILPMNRS